MNNWLSKMERKFGGRAVPHLSAVIIGCYVVGYILQFINADAAAYMTLEPAYILQGQVWRILTWIIIPPSALNLFTIIMLFFYFSIGTSLERAWGNFRYNVYIFGGFLITIAAAFICYFIFSAIYGGAVIFSSGTASPFSTYYICMSIFLAFAATFPEAQVYLYFVIPIKVKWLGVLYAAFLVYDMVGYFRSIASGMIGGWVYVIALVASLLNFVIFFLSTRDFRRMSPSEIRRRREFKKKMQQSQAYRKPSQGMPGAGTAAGSASAGQSAQGRTAGIARHRCEVCGRTEITNPELEFRYCSKCSGQHEYCQDHLFTHQHVK
jgi:hypothetical protein